MSRTFYQFVLVDSLIAVFLMPVTTPADVINGSFEETTIAPWGMVGSGVHESASFDGVSATHGSRFVRLDSNSSTGALTVTELGTYLTNLVGVAPSFFSESYPETRRGSLLHQTAQLAQGSTDIRFQWNFMTNESTPSMEWNDYAFAILFSGSNVVHAAVVDTFSSYQGSGSIYSAHTGWNSVEFTGLAPGDYTLVFGVFDANDLALPAGLMVDNIQAIPEPTTTSVLAFAFGLCCLLHRRR